MMLHVLSARSARFVLVVGLLLVCGPSWLHASEEYSVIDLNRQAYEAFHERDFVRARQLAEQAWQLAEQSDDRRGAGFAAANRGAVLAITSHLDEALEWYETAGARFPADEDPSTMGRLAAARAFAYRIKGENDLAEEEVVRARKILGADDWRIRYATTAFDLWTTLDVFSANDSLEGLLEEAEASSDISRVAVALQVLGWSATAAGWYNDAITMYGREIELFEKSGNPGQAALARRNLGAVYVFMNDPIQATTLLTAALHEARRLEDQHLEFIILNDLSITYAQAGDQQRARAADIEAAEILAAIAKELQERRAELTPSFDYYHLMRLRVLDKPTFLIDPFPWLLDQLALEPTEFDR